jgi:hypothetical protein
MRSSPVSIRPAGSPAGGLWYSRPHGSPHGASGLKIGICRPGRMAAAHRPHLTATPERDREASPRYKDLEEQDDFRTISSFFRRRSLRRYCGAGRRPRHRRAAWRYAVRIGAGSFAVAGLARTRHRAARSIFAGTNAFRCTAAEPCRAARTSSQLRGAMARHEGKRCRYRRDLGRLFKRLSRREIGVADRLPGASSQRRSGHGHARLDRAADKPQPGRKGADFSGSCSRNARSGRQLPLAALRRRDVCARPCSVLAQ